METVELVDGRQRWLLDQLAETGRILTNGAAEELGVSVDTIRRDLRSLHSRGLLRRVHGGAVPQSSLATSFSGRSSDESPSRTALATAVVERLRDGDVVGLDAGSTTVEIAGLLPKTLAVTVVTNSPAVALALADHRSAEVVLLGGSVDLTWMATVGPEVVDGWRNYRLDLAVLGACAFDPTSGASTRSRNEVSTKRALIAAAAETVLPVQAEKVGTQAPFHVAGIDAIDTVLVESLTDRATLDRCRSAGLDVVVV